MLLIKNNKGFFLPLIFVFLVGLYPLFTFDKVVLLLTINRWHATSLDCFYYYITFLGSSWAYLLLITMVAIKKRAPHAFLLGGSNFVCMSLIVQGMKRLLFAHHLRPILLAPAATPLHLVEGVHHHTYLSFPSGHAATIFAAVCFVQLLSSQKSFGQSLCLLLIAVAVAYSRIYLCQHFYEDVYVGAWIGTLTTIVVCAVWGDLLERTIPALIHPWLARRRNTEDPTE